MMENNNQNVNRIILILILIIGIGLTVMKGLNWGIKYGNATTIQIGLGQEFDVNDIKNIVQEVTGGKALVQKVEVFKTTVFIRIKEISDEQIEEIINKINEKYELTLTKEEISIDEITNYRLMDIIKPYIVPSIISTILILVYIGVRFRNIKFVIEFAGKIIITILLVLSLYAIFRFPVNSLATGITLTIIIGYMWIEAFYWIANFIIDEVI